MKIITADDGLNTYYSSEYGQTYHSLHGVFQEAEHIFLIGAGVLEKIQTGAGIKILEIGFGTGFNFFLTAQRVLENKANLEYWSLENDLLTANQFSELNYNNFGMADFIRERFINWRERNENPVIGNTIIDFTDRIKLNLFLGNAEDCALPQDHFDAIYHDAFSPESNRELWTIIFFKQLRDSMKKGAKLSTYSSKGSVRRSMIEAGLIAEKHAGPKGKREMLVAIKDG